MRSPDHMTTHSLPRRLRRNVGSTICLLLTGSLPSLGGQAPAQVAAPTTPPLETRQLLARAEEARAAGSDAAALARDYCELASRSPSNAAFWLHCGRARFTSGLTAGALGPLEKAFELGAGRRASTALLLAKANALLGEKDRAISWLERAFALGQPQRTAWAEEPAFDTLGRDPRFLSLAAVPPASEASPSDGWRFDLDLLVEEAQRLNPDPSRPAHSERFHAAAETLRRRLPELEELEIVRGFMELVTLLGDGHARIVSPELFSFFPIDLYHFEDGTFVVGIEGGLERWIGSRVVAIGGRPIDDLYPRLEALIPRDNPQGLHQRGTLMLQSPAMLAMLGASDGRTMEVTLAGQGGREDRLVLDNPQPLDARPPTVGVPALRAAAASASGSQPIYLARREEPHWLERLGNRAAIYCQINLIVDAPDRSLADLARALTDLATESSARHLVLDLRHNQGGNSFLLPPLVRAIAHFKDVSPHNEVYVLTSRWTFSAAQNLANALDRWIEPLFVGEPTGSSPSFTGEDGPFVLPYSGLGANLSFIHHQGNIYDDRIWIGPDIEIGLSSRDYFAGRDPVMEAVLAIIDADAGG